MKTAEELLIKFYGTDDSRSYDKDVVRIMKEYAEQEVKKHLEIAANEADVIYRGHSFGDYIVDKESITSIQIELT